ncbi:uncharacterized protein BYT42DRAFT_378185 [Radiomyces spectabilis]|uniref:uncharacterized protein n=1 Tax=Radiomyces spectabilis TaxID=64574 RepID=UPI00221E3A36|nr:uncharacterized protein BYT42DRAFT_378185 [Radiomyces spectabilis]KAI8376201.1 hypothetical protein BYT42DRAFT_378185 [Radiomyces spectabilis]
MVDKIFKCNKKQYRLFDVILSESLGQTWVALIFCCSLRKGTYHKYPRASYYAYAVSAGAYIYSGCETVRIPVKLCQAWSTKYQFFDPFLGSPPAVVSVRVLLRIIEWPVSFNIIFGGEAWRPGRFLSAVMSFGGEAGRPGWSLSAVEERASFLLKTKKD